MSDDFTTLLERRLAEAGVELVLVGGFAAIVYGCTYVTRSKL
jgi:hypothetical protein